MKLSVPMSVYRPVARCSALRRGLYRFFGSRDGSFVQRFVKGIRALSVPALRAGPVDFSVVALSAKNSFHPWRAFGRAPFEVDLVSLVRRVKSGMLKAFLWLWRAAQVLTH